MLVLSRISRMVLLIALIAFTACSQPKGKDTSLVNNPKTASGESDGKVAGISFAKTEHDFGKLIQGEKVVHVFHFKNTGTSDLIISQVSVSCGCTASKYTKEAIKPGYEGKIEVTLDTEGQKGIQNKSITVISNGIPQSTTLWLKAQVAIPSSY